MGVGSRGISSRSCTTGRRSAASSENLNDARTFDGIGGASWLGQYPSSSVVLARAPGIMDSRLLLRSSVTCAMGGVDEDSSSLLVLLESLEKLPRPRRVLRKSHRRRPPDSGFGLESPDRLRLGASSRKGEWNGSERVEKAGEVGRVRSSKERN